MTADRPSLIIAATVADATRVKAEFRDFSRYHVMTPRNTGERVFIYGTYIWTPMAERLPARVRWDLRQRLFFAIDEFSEQQPFPSSVLAW